LPYNIKLYCSILAIYSHDIGLIGTGQGQVKGERSKDKGTKKLESLEVKKIESG